jgi:hypothetical protein
MGFACVELSGSCIFMTMTSGVLQTKHKDQKGRDWHKQYTQWQLGDNSIDSHWQQQFQLLNSQIAKWNT